MDYSSFVKPLNSPRLPCYFPPFIGAPLAKNWHVATADKQRNNDVAGGQSAGITSPVNYLPGFDSYTENCRFSRSIQPFVKNTDRCSLSRGVAAGVFEWFQLTRGKFGNRRRAGRNGRRRVVIEVAELKGERCRVRLKVFRKLGSDFDLLDGKPSSISRRSEKWSKSWKIALSPQCESLVNDWIPPATNRSVNNSSRN